MKNKVIQYCDEMTKEGYTCRVEKVEKLLTLPSHKWDTEFSDSEISVASRIQSEFLYE